MAENEIQDSQIPERNDDAFGSSDDEKADVALLGEEDKSKKESDEDEPKELITELPDEFDEEPDKDEEEDKEEDYKGTKPRPAFKDVKAKFPTLFKEFPALREAFFREQKFTEMFPTVEDASEAAGKAEAFDHIEASLLQGSASMLLDGIEKADPEAMNKIANNFLGDIYKRSHDLYYQITTPIVNRLIQSLHEEGKRSSNENLTNSAMNLANFLYGSPNIPTTTQRQEDPRLENERNKLAQERAKLQQDRFIEGRGTVEESIIRILNTEIKSGLDPQVFSETIQDMLSERIQKKVDEAIASDPNHLKLMNSLWKRAEQSGFNRESLSRVRAAYLERARQLMPAIRVKIRSDAIASKKAASAAKDKVINPRLQSSGKIPSGKSTPSAKVVDWNKTSDEDFLNDKITLKR